MNCRFGSVSGMLPEGTFGVPSEGDLEGSAQCSITDLASRNLHHFLMRARL